MSYGVTEDKSVGRFYPGITENVELPGGFTYENSKADGSGKMCLAANFVNEYGGQWRCLFFEVDETRVKEMNRNNPRTHNFSNLKKGIKVGDTITNQQAIDAEYKKFNDYISQIMHIFLTQEEAAIGDVNSYKDFSMKVVEKMKGRTDGIKFRLKTTLNSKFFLQLPRKVNKARPFIESMKVPLENSKLKIYDGEVVTYPVPDNEAVIDSSKPETVSDDMPF